MVTSGTYQRAAVFRSRKRLELLCSTLLQLAHQYSWQLQAWAVFPNHYHFVATSPGNPAPLRSFLQHLHSVTARWANELDATPGRKVWFEYWETQLTFPRSYLARLRYVHQNAVHHGLVRFPSAYPWCSAGWFERKAERSFFRTVMSFTGKGIKVPDDYRVEASDTE